jgi:two-component system, cell cycle sensor histidine kinase and response regulator CckA
MPRSAASSASPGDDPRLSLARSFLHVDREVRAALDRLATLAARSLHTPVAQINLVLPDRQVSLSSRGPGAWSGRRSVPLKDSYCRHVVASAAPLVVEDALADPLVRDNGATTGAGIRAYAAVPLAVGGNPVAGTLCVFDFAPRSWGPEDLELLETLGRFASAELERRGRTEAELLRLAAIVDSVPDAVIGVDARGRVTSWNRGAARLLGPPAEAVLGLPLQEVVPEGQRRHLREPLARAAAGEAAGPYEITAVMREGRPVHLSVTVAPVRDPAGGTAGVAVVIRDVSELARSNIRFRALVEHMGEVITILGADGTILYESPGSLALLGWTPEEMLGRSAFDLVHPEDVPVAEARLADALAHPGRPVPFRLRYRHGDGRWRTFEGVAKNLLDDPAVEGIVANSRDVTERSEAYARLRESEIRLRRLVEQAADAIIVYDIAGNILDVNEAACRMFNHSREDLLVATLDRLAAGQSGEGAERLRRQYEEIRRAGHVTVATTGLRRDGSAFPIEVSMGLYEDDPERPLLLGIVRDLTERVRLEEELRHAQKMEAIGRLAGGIAHDFNNVLTAIRGGADFLLADLPEDHPSRGDAQEIRAAADRGTALTRQLLAFGRKQALRTGPVDLNEVVRGIEPMLRRLIGAEVRLSARLAPGLPPVQADRGQLEQILTNLVVNGRDAMPRGGWLEIGTGREGDPAAPRGVALSVRDTGEGILPELQERIFEPFFTTKAPGEGTGLGLSTVYAVVRHLGGSIRVESAPGEGTAFRIVLPPAPG